MAEDCLVGAYRMRVDEEAGRPWRTSTYVRVVIPWHTSERYGPIILHRSTCRFLTPERRWAPDTIMQVQPTTLQAWEQDVRRSGTSVMYRLCHACCRDLIGEVSTSTGHGRRSLRLYGPSEIDPGDH